MIVFVSNFLNHHQYPVAAQLYTLTDGQYRFIETSPMPDSFKRGGYAECSDLPWLVQAWKDTTSAKLAEQLLMDSDVVIWCHNLYMPIIKKRLEDGRLTFEFGERWLKRGLINLLSPRLLKSQLYYHLYFYNKPLYRLNASAYAANDMALMRSFKNKMFKWGYFTAVPDYIEKKSGSDQGASRLRILFVARFLILKHPEIPVLMAERLKDKGVDFELNMYGSGPEWAKTKILIERKGLTQEVKLKGNCPNAQILEKMRSHDVFLFTSDRHEGWGAVLNEAMSCGCAVVASDQIGSVPFLIKDGENGFIFRNGSVDDITAKVEILANDRNLCYEMGRKAHHTLHDVWSPANAASSLLKLIDGIKSGNPGIIKDGPCSPAYPIKL